MSASSTISSPRSASTIPYVSSSSSLGTTSSNTFEHVNRQLFPEVQSTKRLDLSDIVAQITAYANNIQQIEKVLSISLSDLARAKSSPIISSSVDSSSVIIIKDDFESDSPRIDRYLDFLNELSIKSEFSNKLILVPFACLNRGFLREDQLVLVAIKKEKVVVLDPKDGQYLKGLEQYQSSTIGLNIQSFTDRINCGRYIAILAAYLIDEKLAATQPFDLIPQQLEGKLAELHLGKLKIATIVRLFDSLHSTDSLLPTITRRIRQELLSHSSHKGGWNAFRAAANGMVRTFSSSALSLSEDKIANIAKSSASLLDIRDDDLAEHLLDILTSKKFAGFFNKHLYWWENIFKMYCAVKFNTLEYLSSEITLESIIDTRSKEDCNIGRILQSKYPVLTDRIQKKMTADKLFIVAQRERISELETRNQASEAVRMSQGKEIGRQSEIINELVEKLNRTRGGRPELHDGRRAATTQTEQSVEMTSVTSTPESSTYSQPTSKLPSSPSIFNYLWGKYQAE